MDQKDDEINQDYVKATNSYLFSLCCFLMFIITWSEHGLYQSIGWFVAMCSLFYTALQRALKIK